MLRIVAGQWKGHSLRIPPCVRPTSQKVRAAIFNAIRSRHDLNQTRVLDLFAGSGALGLEAYSQGAALVVFVEQNPAVIQTLRKNIAKLGLVACQVVRAKVETWLKQATPPQPFDIVLLDPPYHSSPYHSSPYHSPYFAQILMLLDQYGWLKAQALVVAETHRQQELLAPPNWTLQKNTRYGDSKIWLYQTLAPSAENTEENTAENTAATTAMPYPVGLA